MSKKAMKLALENSRPSFISPEWTLVRNEDIAALREALEKPDFWEGYVPEPDKRQQALDKKAENARELGLDYEPAQQEPVAWLHTKIEGVAVSHRPADLNKHPDRWEALYKTPPPCPTCEALARTVMMDQTGRDA